MYLHHLLISRTALMRVLIHLITNINNLVSGTTSTMAPQHADPEQI